MFYSPYLRKWLKFNVQAIWRKKIISLVFHIIIQLLVDFSAGKAEVMKEVCILNTECPNNKACIRNHCLDPCTGACGLNAICDIINHTPVCSCPKRMEGSPFVQCRSIAQPAYNDNHNQIDPCNGTCGTNSECKIINHNPVCSCIPKHTGNPLTSCHPIGN